ncbi:GreA/GreB family elongation factor [Filimonas effusa]|uniref:Transcription elongation factor GreAB n=1 Tax=Filimonas effusa TaxID=2508721 RepID=A0A4V1MAG1_9BACT|nr:GreA/GreB family elongation factor [Filimonas effusa]RXK85756.1 transcription elongation factor GreAB [Filimonas effusa]
MSVQIKNPVIVMEEDYQVLKGYINAGAEREDEMTLSSELKRAIVVNKAAFPSHAIRLGSRVSVLDLTTNKVVEFTLVMPADANMQRNKVSILTPIGAALIGFRKGEEVQWQVPGGLKRFRILDVAN